MLRLIHTLFRKLFLNKRNETESGSVAHVFIIRYNMAKQIVTTG